MMQIDIGVIDFIRDHLPIIADLDTDDLRRQRMRSVKLLDELFALAVQSGGITYLDPDAECICELQSG